MRSALLTLALGVGTLALLATPEAQARWRVGPTGTYYYQPDTYFYSPSGKMGYYPYSVAYTPSTQYYYAPSYSLPSSSYGGGFYPPATSYDAFRPTSAYSDYSASAYSGNPAQTARVDMYDNYFSPATLTIRPGTTVRWLNMGTRAHSATSGDGLWETGDLQPGDSYSATFHKQGTYRYRSRLNGQEMTGMVVVQ